MNATRDNRLFGAWTGQVRAIAVAHYFVAAAHLSLVFFVRTFWNKSIDLAINFASGLPDAGALDFGTLRDEFAKLDYFVYIFMAMICVFTVLIALNGWYLARGYAGARVSAIVIGVLLLTAFPPGTIVGAWFIYVLVQREVAQGFKTIAMQSRGGGAQPVQRP
jgi:fatty acid desaturase